MRNLELSMKHTDFLVVGSGISGLIFALKASQFGQVILVTKRRLDETSTYYAQGGIAAAVGETDDPQKHLEDTLTAGAGLCDPRAVEILVNEGVDRVNELIEWGMEFTRKSDGSLDLGREGGHGKSRVLRADDFTGREVENFLIDRLKKTSSVMILENHMAIDLITEHQINPSLPKENVYGAYILNDTEDKIEIVRAHYTVLATGGTGRVYPFTTNPKVATGDGIAMAYRAGCRVRNMEFVQFHPTGFFSDRDPAFLITEAMRGFGGYLRNHAGERFMEKYHPDMELAPRDIVARAIDSELKRTGDDSVYLDVTHRNADEIIAHFPNIYRTLKEEFHLDITREMIPVVPVAHYQCGGILTDYDGRTDLNFLYAVGETASTGIHGGNRLASNSLLEGLVFADRAARDIKKRLQAGEHSIKEKNNGSIPEWIKKSTRYFEEWTLIKHDKREIHNLMRDYVGIVRSDLRLQRAIRRIDLIYEEINDFYSRSIVTRKVAELRNLVLVAQLIIRSSLARKESRGLHYSLDYPEKREPSREDTVLEPSSYPKKNS